MPKESGANGYRLDCHFPLIWSFVLVRGCFDPTDPKDRCVPRRKTSWKCGLAIRGV